MEKPTWVWANAATAAKTRTVSFTLNGTSQPDADFKATGSEARPFSAGMLEAETTKNIGNVTFSNSADASVEVHETKLALPR